MAAKYDPELLQRYADSLYRRAAWVVLRYTVLGFFAGWIGGSIAIYMASLRQPPVNASNINTTLVGVLVAIVAGAYGFSKAFKLKLEAQRTLCQLQIERNTRPPAAEHLEAPEEVKAAPSPAAAPQTERTAPTQVPVKDKELGAKAPAATDLPTRSKKGDVFGLS